MVEKIKDDDNGKKNVWYLLGQVTFSDETEFSTIQSTAAAAGIKGWW